MTVRLLLLRLLPALVATIFVAATPAAAWLDHDSAVELLETVPQSTSQSQPAIDHASKSKVRLSATLEEFFEIDDDAEQYSKPQPGLSRHEVGARIEVPSFVIVYCSAPRTHRVCAAYPTGPPHA